MINLAFSISFFHVFESGPGIVEALSEQSLLDRLPSRKYTLTHHTHTHHRPVACSELMSWQKVMCTNECDRVSDWVSEWGRYYFRKDTLPSTPHSGLNQWLEVKTDSWWVPSARNKALHAFITTQTNLHLLLVMHEQSQLSQVDYNVYLAKQFLLTQKTTETIQYQLPPISRNNPVNSYKPDWVNSRPYTSYYS